jgi:putative phage-type endonuclease
MRTYSTAKEWLKARKSYIGGSDAAAILGLSPYMSNVDLWEIKTGRKKPKDLSDNAIVQFGHDAEPLIRELFKLDFPTLKVFYLENNMFVNDDFPWAHASLDGWLEDTETNRKGILEIKTASITSHAQAQKWKNKIPDNYYCQILHYLMVTGFDFAVLKARLKYDIDGEISVSTKHYIINREDCADHIEYLKETEKRFVEYIKADERPALVLPQI